MASIELTQGMCAIVDDADVTMLSAYKWCAVWNGRNFYAVSFTGQNGKFVYMHKVLCVCDKMFEVDHVNGHTLDNRRSNLRQATSAENKANSGPKNGRKYKGVFKGKREYDKKFTAKVVKDGVQYRLGSFSTAEEAAVAYDVKAAELYGVFAYLNFPEK